MSVTICQSPLKVLPGQPSIYFHHAHFLLQIIMTFIILPSCPNPVLNSLLVSDLSHCPLCPLLISSPLATVKNDNTTFDFPWKKKVALNQHGTEELPSAQVVKCYKIVYCLLTGVENNEKSNKPNDKNLPFCPLTNLKEYRGMSLVYWET